MLDVMVSPFTRLKGPKESENTNLVSRLDLF